MDGKFFFDKLVEQGDDGRCRGKVWVVNKAGKVSELHFDAASWDDARALAVGLLEVHKAYASPLVRV